MANGQSEIWAFLDEVARVVAGGASRLATGGLPAMPGSAKSGVSGVLDAVTPVAAQASPLSWISPVAGLVSWLAGGGGEEAPAAAAKYVWPEKVQVNAGFAGSQGERVDSIDHDALGTARPASVVVQVTAMDSTSFLERTPEIVTAVKRALLETESLGGVLGEM